MLIECRGFKPESYSKVLLGDAEATIASASDDKIIVRLPDSPRAGLTLQVGGVVSDVYPFNLATRLAMDLHPVANPVIAPDGTIITTVSGARGQHVPQPLIRLTRRGDRIPYQCEITNPTGLAFSKDGQLYISSRHDGTVLRYTNFEQLEVFAEDLGVPCGMVFDSKGFLYVGDRMGKIYRIDPSGSKEEFASLEPSISAYHMAIDAEDRLYVTGPTFSMRDSLFRVYQKRNSQTPHRGISKTSGIGISSGRRLADLQPATKVKRGYFDIHPRTDPSIMISPHP